MSQLEIQSALAQHLNDMNGLPDIKWPGKVGRPTEGTTFVRPRLIPFDSEVDTFELEQIQSGIYQVALFYPIGTGEGDVIDMAERVRQHYRIFRTLQEGDTCVHIQSISIGEVVVTDAWLQCNVDIGYRNRQQ